MEGTVRHKLTAAGPTKDVAGHYAYGVPEDTGAGKELDSVSVHTSPHKRGAGMLTAGILGKTASENRVTNSSNASLSVFFCYVVLSLQDTVPTDCGMDEPEGTDQQRQTNLVWKPH